MDDLKKETTANQDNGRSLHPMLATGQDPVKLRLIFLKKYCTDNVEMYKRWSKKPKCKHFKEKADAYYDVAVRVERLIQEIESGNVVMPCC